MYGSIKVFDHNIIAINHQDATIVYRKGKELHQIDLKACADNFKKQYSRSTGTCVGDRNIEKNYFSLYTNGIHTVISFRRVYIFNLSGKKLFDGTKTQRFVQFKKKLAQLGYATYDLT